MPTTLRVGIVGCGSAKREHAAPAKDLYTSSYFALKRQFAEEYCDQWYVFSAKHGLVAPDTVLDPYDASLSPRSDAYVGDDPAQDLGAEVREISVPWHEDGLIVWLAVETEAAATLWETEGTGYFVGGEYDTDFASAFGSRRRARGAEFAPTVKLKMVFGRYLRERFHGRFHRKAQNLRRDLTAAYDEALSEVDLLAMPTTPMTAFERVDDLSRQELVQRAAGKTGRTRNTMPFDMTGHPAISVPCGLVDGLPAGLMLVGERFDETTVLRAADAFENATDWRGRAY